MRELLVFLLDIWISCQNNCWLMFCRPTIQFIDLAVVSALHVSCVRDRKHWKDNEIVIEGFKFSCRRNSMAHLLCKSSFTEILLNSYPTPYVSVLYYLTQSTHTHRESPSAPVHPATPADGTHPLLILCFCLSTTCLVTPWPPGSPVTPSSYRVQSKYRCLPPSSASSRCLRQCPACRPDTTTTA